MKNFLRNYAGYNLSHSNSYVATAFAVIMTTLIVSGYEVTQSLHDTEAAVASTGPLPAAIARLETIVVTAKRSGA